MANKQGWREAGQITADGKIKAPKHVIAANKADLKDVLRQPIKVAKKIESKEKQFRKEFSSFLTRLQKHNSNDTTIPEFKRWLKEDMMPFSQKPAFEQISEKTDYEKEIGNDSDIFRYIKIWLDIWVKENEDQQDSFIWYHGTTEEKYQKIKKSGTIKVSTSATAQHSGFERDIGTISLAKYKGMAHFFSALTGQGKHDQTILHIDTKNFDPTAIKKRKLINTPDGEMLYSKNIPVSAIVKAEKVYVRT